MPGLSDIWINQSFSSKTWSGLAVEQRAKINLYKNGRTNIIFYVFEHEIFIQI